MKLEFPELGVGGPESRSIGVVQKFISTDYTNLKGFKSVNLLTPNTDLSRDFMRLVVG